MYTVKYLSDQEFDMLPYKYARESLGCADAKTGTAYIRQTGIKPLDAYVTEHELDELVAKVSPHEQDGIRYKKGKDIFRKIGGAIVGVVTGNPWLGAAVGTGLGFGLGKGGFKERLPGGITGGVGGFTGGKFGGGFSEGFTAAGTTGAGFLGKVGAGLKSGAGALGFGGGSTAAAGAKGASLGLELPGGVVTGPAAGSALLPSGQSVAQAFPAATAPSLGFGAGGVGAGATGGLAAGAKGLGAQGTSTAAQAAQQAGGAGTSPLRQLIGGGTAVLGQFAGPKPTAFDPSQGMNVQELTQRIQSGKLVDLTPDQESAIVSQIQERKEIAIQSLKDRFKALRPGSDIENDSQFRSAVAELEAEFESQSALELLRMKLGLSQQQTENISQLANLDVFTLAREAQISEEEAAQFKQLMADLGIGIATGFGSTVDQNQGFDLSNLSRIFQ